MCNAPWLDPYWATQMINGPDDLTASIFDLRNTWCIRVRGWNGGFPTGDGYPLPANGTDDLIAGHHQGCWFGDCVSGAEVYLGEAAEEYEMVVGYSDGSTGDGEITSDSIRYFTRFYAASGGNNYWPYYYPNNADMDSEVVWQQRYYCLPRPFVVGVTIFTGPYAQWYPLVRYPEWSFDPLDTLPGVVRCCSLSAAGSDSADEAPAFTTWEHWDYGSVSIADLIRPVYNATTMSWPYFRWENGLTEEREGGPRGGDPWIGSGCRPDTLSIDFF
jgi:hypothetical protein